MFGHLVVDGHDDLALVDTLIWSLYVLDLQSVSRTGRVISHTERARFKKKIENAELINDNLMVIIISYAYCIAYKGSQSRMSH